MGNRSALKRGRMSVQYSRTPDANKLHCGCHIFAAVLVYGTMATVAAVVFVYFYASSGHQYGSAAEDPFSASNYYRRKVKGDSDSGLGLEQGQGVGQALGPGLDLYHPEQSEDHAAELQRRLTDLRNDYRNVKDLKSVYKSHCKTCSIVASSGQLLRNRAGEEIDSAECVIRMNKAPVVGFEDYVGRRTTTRIVCFNSVGLLKKGVLAGAGHTDEVVVWGSENRAHGSYSMVKLKMLAKQYPGTHWYSLKDTGEQKASAIFESETGISRSKSNTWLSTGLFTMLYALETCDNITVYGMIDEHHCDIHGDQNVPYHYYEQLPWSECEYINMHEKEKKIGHRYLTEKALFRRFSTMFNLKFSHPAWNLSGNLSSDFKSPFHEKYIREHPAR
ncbi:alpha-N-acetyl-neuraminyl-2,3-beta-galactosyl-1,3-N-acetyl-galactosaminide alpha-2,6-sialyltransferase-like isoform X1 [Diadema antillarum]|uniref:alpha-N-acetyl-neuraminyl-2,3-beta-galactosyl-1, 3-N-acetyl-galactosaminide alpha-2,6-sialyltransferase-like isoform X1 n=1 Tax=Diadema antillarum TaxID=105358 RepID=UPI003A88262F